MRARASARSRRDHAGGVGRVGRAAAWISAVCCLPYLSLKVLWTFDVAVGIEDRSVLDSSDWVAGNALMAVLQLAGLLLVVGLTRPWAWRVPRWLLLFPVWVGTGLLFEVAVGALLMGAFSASSEGSSEGADLGGIQPWVYVLVYSAFAGQGIALAIAFASHLRVRWGRLLGQRTDQVLAGRPASALSWPQVHLAGLATAAAGLAVAVGVVCAFWAIGGSFGASALQPDPTWPFNAMGVVAAAAASAGLLALAGRWARRTRFWVPAGLTWIGSGALAAFDGLILVFYVLLGTDGSDTGWGATDTVIVAKVLVGVLAGLVGAVAVATAANDDARPHRLDAEEHRSVQLTTAAVGERVSALSTTRVTTHPRRLSRSTRRWSWPRSHA